MRVRVSLRVLLTVYLVLVFLPVVASVWWTLLVQESVPREQFVTLCPDCALPTPNAVGAHQISNAIQ